MDMRAPGSSGGDSIGIRRSSQQLCDCQPLAEPCCKSRLADRTACNSLHGSDGVERVKAEPASVIGKEEARGNPGCALVPIHKAMIFRDTVRIGCCKICRVRLPVTREVDRSGKGTLYTACIANALRSTMLGNLPVMDGADHGRVYPAPVSGWWVRRCAHFARARSTSRSSCMISSARSICRAKSGLYGVRR